MSPQCCLRSCDGEGDATLRIELLPPPDAPPVVYWAHASCFSRLAHPSVEPDHPVDFGGVPSGARCVVCGRRLPIAGRHPFVLDTGESLSPRRFWVHAECIALVLCDSLLERLGLDL